MILEAVMAYIEENVRADGGTSCVVGSAAAGPGDGRARRSAPGRMPETGHGQRVSARWWRLPASSGQRAG